MKSFNILQSWAKHYVKNKSVSYPSTIESFSIIFLLKSLITLLWQVTVQKNLLLETFYATTVLAWQDKELL